MCLVVFLQAIEDVVDGGAHVAGGAVLSEFAASEAGVGPLRGVVLAGGTAIGRVASSLSFSVAGSTSRPRVFSVVAPIGATSISLDAVYMCRPFCPRTVVPLPSWLSYYGAVGVPRRFFSPRLR